MTDPRRYPDILYTVGLDLGQARDYTALAVLETQVWIAPDVLQDDLALPDASDGWHAPTDLTPALRRLALAANGPRWPGRPPLALRHLERIRHVPYPEVVRQVVALTQRTPLAGNCHLVIDATGVGRGVVDMFEEAGLRFIRASIHGGDRLTINGNDARVPKRDLVGAVQTALHSERLLIAADMPHAATLRHELEAFRVTINPATAHDSYSAWREQDHDDLVLATALAVWWRDWYWQEVDAQRRQSVLA